jgi:hypothetical protein
VKQPDPPATRWAKTKACRGEAQLRPQSAEQHFPVSIVTLHGLLAVTTVVLVFLAAIGV